MLLTTSQAAAELGCAVTTFRRLVRTGLIPGVVSRGVRVMVPLEAVQALSTRRKAALHCLPVAEIAVLRIRGAESPHATSGAGQQGFSADTPAAELLANLRGWWRCDAPSVAAGGALPVTVAGYVVAVLTNLHRWESSSEGRTLFPDAVLAGYVTDLARPTVHLTAQDATDRATAQLLLGSRLTSDSGGPIAYVSTRNPDVTQG
ncbi:helix-turn-helix domain-containing protein [Streptomyces sp. NPDC014861]|uniref:helix-turn-helix domain-containing protein n=1 Tax=Streptomyces sp. NPDC014861 TaxID=3364923 RepID=UPI003701DE2E